MRERNGNNKQGKYRETAIRIDEAFLALLEEKDLEYITVKEICKTANVHRSTFYLHYDTIDDLLRESTEYLSARFSDYFPHELRDVAGIVEQASLDDLYLIKPEYLIPYLTFIKEHQRLYRAALERPTSLQTQRQLGGYVRRVINPIMARYSIPEREREYVLAFYIEGITAIVKTWLSSDCADPIELVVKLIMDNVPSGRN